MKQSTFSAVMANSIKNLLQGYTKGIRFTAILTILFTIGVGQMWGAEETYEKVTSAPSDWSGEYLIVYEGGKVAFNGNLTSLDAASNIQSVTITNNQIKLDSKYSFTITKSGTNYTIKSASGKYIGNNSNSNALTSSNTALNNTISFASKDDITIKSSGGAYLRYNSASDQKRFRYYKSSSYTGQKAICLYKKAVTTYTVTYDLNGGIGTTPTQAKVAAGGTFTLAASSGFSKAGYSFAGWNDGTTTYNAGATYTMPAKAVTLKAQWTCATPVFDIKIKDDNPVVFSGESIELTVVGSNIAADATYQWYKKNGESYDELTGQKANKLTIAEATANDAGNYKCVVTNGTCSGENNYTVKMYHIKGLTDGTWTTPFEFVKSGDKEGTFSVELAANTTYYFKLNDGSVWYWNEGTMTHNNCTDWMIEQEGADTQGKANTGITTTASGTYIFTLNYEDPSKPKLSVTYPQKKMVYLNPGNWNCPKYAVYSWNGEGNSTVLMTKIDDCADRNIYQAEIDASHSNVIFIGGTASYNVADTWNNVSYQTIDLTYPSDDKVLYEINTTHLFLVPNSNWKQSNARFAAYFYGNGETWVSMTKVTADLYKVAIPTTKTYPSVIFCRMNPSATANNWNNKWNQSADLPITKGKNHYTVAEGAWDKGDGTWKTAGEWTSFTPNYSVIFDANGHGTAPADQCIAEGGKVTTPTAPTATGYTFGGWYKEADCTNAWDFANDVVNSDITLYAKWTANIYNLTWNVNGGDALTGTYTSGSVAYGTIIVPPATPTRTGHTFLGWNPAFVEGTTMPDNDLTYTAQWQICSYTLTWYLNGGTVTTAGTHAAEGATGSLSGDVEYGASITAPIVERESHRFDGWHNGTAVVEPATTMGTSNLTYTAQWTPTYTITWLANGQEFHKQENAVEGTALDLPDSEPDAEEYACDDKVFVGWTATPISGTKDDEPADLFTTKTAKVEDAATTYYAVFATAEGGGTENLEATLSFADKAQRTTYTTSQQVWEQNGITLTNDKASSTSNVGDYANPARFYKSSDITIEAPGKITKIVFNCSESKYTTSIAGFSADGTTITVTQDGTSTTFSTNLSEGQVRLNSLVVTYTTSGGTSYSDYTTSCVALPDPVISFVTTPADPIVFDPVNCGSTTSKAQAKTVQVSGANLQEYVSVEVTGPYKIARTSSTNLSDYTTSLTLDKTNTGNINANYSTIYIISCPPAQSTDATTGTLTFTTKKGNTLTVNLSTPTVNCTTYALTFNDRGNKTVENYYAGEEVPQPVDPTGVCTEPIHYVFDGWAEATVANGSTEYTKVTFPYSMPGQNNTLYAVYRYLTSGGNGDYNLVTSALDDWSGDYLIAYNDQIFADGRIGGKDDSGMGDLDVKVDLSDYISDNTIPATEGDKYNVTLEAVSGGYLLKTKDGKYNYQSSNVSGLSATDNQNTASEYKLYVDFVSSEEVNLCLSGNAEGAVFRYNTTGYFRFYKNGGQAAVYLYKKASGTTLYTSAPVCGPLVEITSDKDIYVTGGKGVHSTVVAQKKITFAATRLKPSAGGAAPSIKVPAADITLNGSKTDKVKIVDITQNIVLQDDGITYAGTGEITISYTPTDFNVNEDINVQLRAEHNTGSDVILDAFTVHARSLPEEFVIVAKSGDKWYALNGDMSNGSSANPANGQVVLDDDTEPTKATYAPCNTIYTFDGLPNTGDRKYVRFQGTDGAWLWASSGTNVGVQNKTLAQTPAGDNKPYNWEIETTDNITYFFHNANSSRVLRLNDGKFGMYVSGTDVIRILPYEAKCLYNYAPSNLKVSELKGTHVTLTWDAVAGATKYQYSTDATNWTDAGTEPTVTISGLSNGTNYTYYIRAYHADAGVSQECFDYSEVSFTTADCDDVPTDITYTADLNSITVSWTASAATATIKLYSDEAGEHAFFTQSGATSPWKISSLQKNTTYYLQIFAGGTCASQIIPVKTEDVKVDIVEWMEDGIIVDINTNETVGVTLENEVSYGSGTGSEATELFFSKYYEATTNVKLVAIYNGTKNIIDLTDYEIHYGKTPEKGWETNYITLKDFGEIKGTIQPGEELILYTMSDSDNSDKQIMNCVNAQYPNGKWVRVTQTNNTGKGSLSFAGDKTIVLKKAGTIIDIIGAINSNGLPNNAAVTRPSWGDANGWTCATGLSIADDTEIGISTNRCLLIRNNTVTSGENAVTSNINDFVTLCSEWKGAQVPDNDTDNGVAASCENFAYVGTFDYSDYYTKYVPMDGGTSTFDENNRNPDGTVSIDIPDLYKRACSNIRVKLTNSDGEVLTDREYKVPIMITTTQATAYSEENKTTSAFYALQNNLATIETDANGNVIARHPLSLDEVREICKTCDVVIRDNATLTKVTDGTTNDHPQVRDVMIYEGASLEVDGANHNYTINSLSLRRKGDVVASANIKNDGQLILPNEAATPISLDLRVDAKNWHWFTLPYDCNIADVTWVDGTPAQYNVDWFLMYYDGESRSASTNPYDNHWKVYNGTTIEAGKGYIVGIKGNLSKPDYTFELRFPMAAEVLTHEHTDKHVAVNAWGVKSDNTPNNLGWNLVGNPYLDYYQPSTSGFNGLPLIKYTNMDPVTGEWHYDESGEVPFIVTPVNGGWYEYKQELASEVEMMPFTAYFVQVGNPKIHENGAALNAEFIPAKRGRASLIQRAANEVDEVEEPIIVGVELTNSKGESDKTTLIIDDRFTSDYEMNADFFKWFGDYYKYYTKPVLYSVGADAGKRAFNALSEQLAAQPIPLGMFAAQAGDYTFTLTRKRCDLSSVEEVWLYDATNGTYTNLMQQDYTFTTAKTEGEGRFYLSVKMRQNAPTDITDIYGGNIVASAKDGQIIVSGLTDNTQLWIYDATGKLLHTEQTTNFQYVYEVPVVGTYFVRTQLAGQAQTIKVLVE